MDNETTILVTGGAGFIGSNFIEYLLEKYPSYKVVCFDALTYAGNRNNLKNAFKNDNFIFIKGDITNIKKVDSVFKKYKFDYVVNFAAESHVSNSIINPLQFIKTNIYGVQVLLDASKKYNVKRFHQISTDEVYGELNREEINVFFTEESKLNPQNPYAVTKASADMLVLSYHRNFKLDITISRCTNNYGKYQHKEKFIPYIINQCINNKKVYINGDGKNIRDWIYVLDHCIAIDLILHKGKSGEIYNVGTNTEKTNLEVAKLILNEFGLTENKIAFIENRIGEDEKYAICASKIRNELGFKETTTFQNGIKQTINWYKDNIKWWEKNGNL